MDKYFMAYGVRVEIDWINSCKEHQTAHVPRPKELEDEDDMWGVYERLPDGTTELLGLFPLAWRASDFMKSLQ